MRRNQTIDELVTDADFFSLIIDADRIEGVDLKGAIASRDWISARFLFADYIRRWLQPERYLASAPFHVRKAYFLPRETWREAADRIVSGTLVSTGTAMHFPNEIDWHANPTANRYPEWTWQLNRHHDWQILAKAYQHSNDEQYANTFVHQLRSWLKQVEYPLNHAGHETDCWRTIEAGIRMKDSWPYALHSFIHSSAISDDDLLRFFKAVWLHAERLKRDYQQANWLVIEMTGLAHVAVLYPFFREAKEWQDFALRMLTEQLQSQFYPDGFQYELSTGYHYGVLNNYVKLIRLCRSYEVGLPKPFEQMLERGFEIHLKLMMPDGRLPDLNDGSWLDVQESMQIAASLFPQRKDFLWAATRGKEGAPPEWTSISMPYSGFFVLRSGWERDAFWMMLDVGPFGRAHQHEDKLNLLLHANGRLLLTEGGNYAYDASEMRQYVLSTRAHNTVRVDGEDQNRRAHYHWQAEDIDRRCEAIWQENDDAIFLSGSYTDGYGYQAANKVTHTRKVIWIKNHPILSPFLLVIDELKPADPKLHHYELLWHPTSDTVHKVGLAAHCGAADEPGLVLIPSQLPQLKLDIVKGQTEPEWQGWKVVGNGFQGEYQEAPVVRYTWEALGPSKIVTVLYPVCKGESCPIKKASYIDGEKDQVQLKLDTPSRGDDPFIHISITP